MSEWGKQAKKTDKAFSDYIRKRDNWTCVICGCQDREILQSGHLFSRQNTSTRWDPEAVFCQCSYCNDRHEYDTLPYFTWFIQEFGKEKFQELKKKSWQIKRMYVSDMKDLEKYFREKAKEIYG